MTAHQHDREQDRKAFELWVQKRHGCSIEKWKDTGEYIYHNTRRWWECWQAATAAAVPPGHVVVPVSVAKDAVRSRWIKATRYEHDRDDDPDSAWAKAWDEIEGMVGATGDIDSAIDRAMIAAAEGK